VTPVYLFDLASRHMDWLTVRQTATTGNIANANTPGYQAMDVQPFSDVLDETSLAMAHTGPGHIGADDAGGETAWSVKETGGAVNLTGEMLKADSTNRAFSLDTDVVRAFHRMLMTSLRSGA
jgi:flagellar basal-body rod protein FlgB